MSDDLSDCITGLVYGYNMASSIITGHKRAIFVNRGDLNVSITNISKEVGQRLSDMINNREDPFSRYLKCNSSVNWKDSPDFNIMNMSANFSIFEDIERE